MQFDYRLSAFRRLTEQAFLARDDVVLVEISEAQAIARELPIAGQPGLEPKRPVMLTGRIKHSAMKSDVILQLDLTRGDEPLESWTSAEEELGAAATHLVAATGELFNKAVGSNKGAGATEPATELAIHGKSLFQLGFREEACEMFEAALLLKPADVELHHQVSNAMGEQLFVELQRARQAAVPTRRIVHEVIEAEAEFCKTNADRIRVGMSHLEAYLGGAKISNWTYVDTNSVFAIFAGAPANEFHEMAYRVLKRKFDANVKDDSAEALRQMLQRRGALQHEPLMQPADQASFMCRLSDVWISGRKNVDFTYFVLSCSMLANTDDKSPEMLALLTYLEKSLNPEARRAVIPLRKAWAQSIDVKAKAQPQSKPAAAVEDSLNPRCDLHPLLTAHFRGFSEGRMHTGRTARGCLLHVPILSSTAAGH